MTCNIPPPRTLRAHSEVRETVLTAQGLRVPDAYCLHTICLFPVILRGDCECWYAIATKSKKDRPKAITNTEDKIFKFCFSLSSRAAVRQDSNVGNHRFASPITPRARPSRLSVSWACHALRVTWPEPKPCKRKWGRVPFEQMLRHIKQDKCEQCRAAVLYHIRESDIDRFLRRSRN